MARSKKDQQGGHPLRHSGVYSCGCCEILCPEHKSSNRTKRKRSWQKHERRAN